MATDKALQTCLSHRQGQWRPIRIIYIMHHWFRGDGRPWTCRDEARKNVGVLFRLGLGEFPL